MPAPADPPRSTRLGIIALAVAVAVAGVLGVMHLRSSDALPAGTAAFVAGGGVTYTSTDGAFQVQLPQAPVLEQRVTTIDSEPVTIYAGMASSADYDIGALSVELSSAATADRINAVLNAALDQSTDGVVGKLVSKGPTSHGSLPAIEARFAQPDGSRAHLLVVSSGTTIIVLFVHAKTGTDRLYKALEDSLIIR